MPTSQRKATTTTTNTRQTFAGPLDQDDLLSQVADLEASVQLARALDESLASSTSRATAATLNESNSSQSPLAKIIDIQKRTKSNINNKSSNKLQDENNNIKFKPSIKSPSGKEENGKEDGQQGDQFRATNKQTPLPSSASSTGGQHHQPHPTWTTSSRQQPAASAPGKQQSGETLSSFESDYDLLVYLGETETEDLVDTERSLDYQDQTWRQSICGGASLAPTIDESLSELLSTSVTPASQQNLFGPSPSRRDHSNNNRIQQDLADDLLLQTPSFNRRLYQQQQQLTTTTPKTPLTNYSASLPRQPTATGARRQTTTTTTTTTTSTKIPSSQANYYAHQANKTTSANVNSPKWSADRAASRRLERADLECDNEVSLAFNEQRQAQQAANEPAASWRNQQVAAERHLATTGQQLPGDQTHQGHQQQQQQSSLAGNLGKKVVSLFNRKAPQQHQTSTPPTTSQQQVGGGGQLAPISSSHQSSQVQPGQQTMATRGGRQQRQLQQSSEAAELDRLLAEMSQSLDLDSLARYDPFRGRSAPLPGANQVEPSRNTSTLNSRQTRPANESILDEYEGASRMLEQMISDQLGESTVGATSAATATAPTKSRASPASKSFTSNNSSSASSKQISAGPHKPTASATKLTRQITVASEPDCSHESSASRKMSTCSSSQATDLSVIPNTKFASPIQSAGAKPSDEIYENRSVWRYRGNLPLSKGSLAGDKTNSMADVERTAASKVGGSQPTSRLNSKSSLLLDQSLPVASIKSENNKWSQSLDNAEVQPSIGLATARSQAGQRQGSSSPPPPPPAVDYDDDDDDHDDQNVISVEAAALSSSDSELEAWRRQPAGDKSKVDLMKRRTLSGMRSMRNKLSNLMKEGPTGASKRSQEARQAEPKPPKRSSSIGSSHAMSSTTKPEEAVDRWQLEERIETSQPAQHVARLSRGRERQRAMEPKSETNNSEAKSFGQQLRERLSRSKSRFSHFLRPSSSKRRAQSTPDDQRHLGRQANNRTTLATIDDDRNNHNLLFQPSDIARNTRPAQSGPLKDTTDKTPDRGYDSSLERHLKADLMKPKPDNRHQQGQPRKNSTSSASTSSSSSSNQLSGLESTKAPKRVARRRQGNTKNNSENKRPSSLISIKRLSSSFKQRPSERSPTIEDLDSMKVSSQTTTATASKVAEQPLMAAAVARVKRKRRQRRNKSAGDSDNDHPDDDEPLRPARLRSRSPTEASMIKPKLTTTDDYFGLVAPARAIDPDSKKRASPVVFSSVKPVHLRVEMGPDVRVAQAATSTSDSDPDERRPSAKRKLPDRSQSLRSVGKQCRSPNATQHSNKLLSDRESAQAKAVSFSNLANTFNQRRPLPTSANSFRPTSALAKLDTTKTAGDHREPPTTATTTTTTVSVEPDGRVVTPIRPRTSPPPATLSPPTSRTTGTKSPIRDKGAALMDDFRVKCGKLASKLSIPTRRAPTPPLAPVRPPRSRRRDARDTQHQRRSKSLAAPKVAAAAAADEEQLKLTRLIEAQPSSPPASLSLQGGASSGGTMSPVGSNKSAATTRPTNKLSTLAGQIRSTASELFHPTIPFDQSTSATATAGKLSAGGPWESRTSQRQPMRSLEEPAGFDDLCQWRPVIASSRAPQESPVARRSSFRLIRKDDSQSSGTVNRTSMDLIRQQQQRSIDTDSTWESASDDNDERKQEDELVVRDNERQQQQVVADGSRDKSDSNVAPPASQSRAKTEPELTDGEQMRRLSQRQQQQLTGRDNFNSNNTSPLADKQQVAQLADIKPVEQYGEAERTTTKSSITADQNNNNNNENNKENDHKTKRQQVEPRLQVSRRQWHQSADERQVASLSGTNRQPNNNRPNINQQVAAEKHKPAVNYDRFGDWPEDTASRAQELNIDKRRTGVSLLGGSAGASGGGQVEEISKSPFKFNSDLPSPTQVLSLAGCSSSPLNQQQQHHLDEQTLNKGNSGESHVPIGQQTTRPSKFGQEQESNQSDEPAATMLSGGRFAAASISSKMKQKDTATNKMDEVDANFLKATSHTRAKANRLIDCKLVDNEQQARVADQDEWHQNRLSIYENVTEPTRVEPNLTRVQDDDNDEWSVENQPTPTVPDPVRKLAEHFKNEARIVRRASDNKITIELQHGSQQQQQQQQGAEDEPTIQGTPRRPERKLVTMTSIINEPEDELMNISRASSDHQSGQQPVDVDRTTAQFRCTPKSDDRRRDSTFGSEDPLAAANCNSDSESSSFADAVASRKRRLMNKFEERRPKPATSRPADLPKAPKVVASTSVSVGLIGHSDRADGMPEEAASRRPPATRGPVGGSLVRRLAKTFDQQGQQQQQEAARKAGPALRRAAGSVEEEPKSDSTWYDAKSIELLDEAELEELLRELDSDDDDHHHHSSHTKQVSTGGEENYVSAGESALSHGRRDKHPAAGDDEAEEDEDATTLDDDETLNDDEDDITGSGDGDGDGDGGQQVAKGDDQRDEETSESIYASAAAASLSQVVDENSDTKEGKCNNNNNNSESEKAIERLSSLSTERAAPCDERIACDLDDRVPVGLLEKRPQKYSPIDDLNPREDVHIIKHDKHDELSAPLTHSTDPTEHSDSLQNAQREQLKNTCQSQQPAPPSPSPSPSPQTTATTTTTTATMTRHQLNIDQTFKNSLNNIISLRSTNKVDEEAAGRRKRAPTDTGRAADEPPAPANSKTKTCHLAKELARYYKAIVSHGKRSKRRRSYKPLDVSALAAEPTSAGTSGGHSAGTLDANDSTVTICNIKPTHEPNATRDSSRPQSLSPHSSSSSNSATASTLSSDEDEEEEEDDDDDDDIESGDELDARSIVKAAKKCSQLYEVFEQMLVVRAADEEKRRRLEAASKQPTGEQDEGQPGGKQQVDEDDYYDDEDELSALTELRDDRSSLSSSSMSSISIPEMKQRQNLQKLYHIVQEIYSSEEKFVQTLRLLNVDFRNHIVKLASRAHSSASSSSSSSSSGANQERMMQQPPYDCVALMLKHLPQLQALNENLLEELKVARDHWPKTQKVSHVLVKIGPFLKHYSSYIREFECIQSQFMDNIKKYPQFSQQVREFESREPCQKLTIQHHLLKPIQRIPQYRLLLQQYLHHLKPDDLDYEDTVSALEVVSRVAEHANESLNEGANFAKLLALQAKIVGKQRDIVQPGRLFIKEGELMKICRKQIQPRWFVLLSDSLLYLTQIQSSDILYLNNEIPLDENCQVTVAEGNELQAGTQDNQETEFNLYTSVRSFSLIAKSRQERDTWVEALRTTIDDRIARRRTFSQVKGGGANDDDDDDEAPLAAASQETQLIGRKAPLWTPDSRVTMCQLCTSNFSTLFRRHHCRGCGRVVCSACSSNKAPLIYLKCRAARVCDQCFVHLKANIHLYYLPQAARVPRLTCELNNNNNHAQANQHLDERELKRLDEYFRTLLKSQFVRHAGLDRFKETDLFTKKRLYLLLKKQ